MFKKDNRYLTRNIQEQLSIELQLLLWESIDEQNDSRLQLDYLQIVTFQRLGEMLAIRLEQEQPERLTVLYLPYSEEYAPILIKKVYIIDSEEYSTMLFSEEY